MPLKPLHPIIPLSPYTSTIPWQHPDTPYTLSWPFNAPTPHSDLLTAPTPLPCPMPLKPLQPMIPLSPYTPTIPWLPLTPLTPHLAP